MHRTFGHLAFWASVLRKPEGEGSGSGDANANGQGQQQQPTGDGNQGGTPAAKLWYDDLQEQPVKELMATKGYKDPAHVAVAYHNLNKLVSSAHGGVDGLVAIPGADATQEVKDAFYAKLGRPDAPDKYELKLPDGVTPDDPTMQFGRDAFHAAGLAPQQAQVISDKWHEFLAKQAEGNATQFAATNAAEVDAVKKSLGDGFDAALAGGRRVVASLGLDQDTLNAVEGSIGGAAMLKLFTALGAKSSEGNFTGGGQGGGPADVSNMSPAQAQNEISKLQGDAAFMEKYGNKNHPENKAAIARMEQLYAKAG